MRRVQGDDGQGRAPADLYDLVQGVRCVATTTTTAATTSTPAITAVVVIVRRYEKLVEDALKDFGQAEGMEADELGEMIQTAMRQDEGSSVAATKSVTMLVAAADYKKFCRMMRQKSKEAPREVYF